ncbi:MAG: hypothetical protein COZ21_09690 [Bacteroidetes bacterium CG_4_10_14_3_um_filter_31_20]|nr:hypothetical protein [Bacteroidota bacterium]PIY03305.1 MAG: hypothetical protein COZ21_09690 [Bacteroidetes bacterium CG_4_10_14_3_um_filter_31_20]
MLKCIYLYCLLSVASLILNGCNKFDKEEPIPSYIRISKVNLICDSITQGSSQNNITDIWVNLDGNKQGTYEIPTIFPIIAEGKHNLILRAGIKVNGISTSRIIFPFYNQISIDTNFISENKLNITPTFTYIPETQFAWLENFQNNGFTLDRTSKSDTLLYIENDSVNTNQKYGVFYIDTARKTFQYKSTEKYYLLSNGSAIFLELDYQCDYPFSIGVIINKLTLSIETPIIYINPHPQSFNHIYIDLSYIISQNTDALNYNIFFGSTLDDGYNKGEVKIDNIKLIHF